MSALATFLRERAADEVSQLEPGERLQLALALGDEDVRLYCEANGVPIDQGRRRLMTARQIGRRRSVAADAER